MKKIILVLLILVVVLLRLNLPPNNINDNFSLKSDEGIVEELASRFTFSDAIADWQYLDLIVVKYACSERVGMSLIAMPFSKWKVHEENVTSCDSNQKFREFWGQNT
jgi:hypothetical protein